MPLRFLVVLLALVLVGGCAASSETGRDADERLHLPAVFVTPQWLARHLEDPRLVVVHVGHGRRGYDERGHIPGAVFLEPRDLVVERDGRMDEMPDPEVVQELLRSLGINRDSIIVLYGEAAGLFAGRAYVTLAAMGLGEQTAILDGQLRVWQAQGYPTTTDAVSRSPGDVVLERVVDVLADADDVLEATRAGQDDDAPAVALVDTRSAQQYVGERRGRGAEAAGHIPGAVHAYWRDQIVSIEQPSLRPLDDLRSWYAQLGVAAGTPVIIYSNTGMQAGLSFAVLRHLGHPVRFYDGSMDDWTARGLPTAAD